MAGLYEIIHVASGRAYVGSSVDVARRLRAHRALLRRGRHDNVWLQRAWARDGEDAFAFRPLAECPADVLREREADCIAERAGRTYNLSPVVGRGRRAPNSALADDDVRALYDRAARGESVPALARAFGITVATARRVVAGLTYQHVTGGVRARDAAPATGHSVGASRLTEAQARAILASVRAGVSGYRLARDYGVSHRTVYLIARGETWKHLHAAASTSDAT